MWIETAKDGKYKFRERYKSRDGRYLSVTVTFPNKTRATQKKAAERLAEMIAEKTAPPESTLTLDSVLNDYIASKKPLVKPLTLAHYYREQRRVYTRFEPSRIVTTITAREWQSFLDDVTSTTSAKAARTVHQFVKAAMEQAERLDGINATPIRRAQVVMPKKSVAEVTAAAQKFLTRDELQEVLALIRDKSPYIADICEFQALTGLRYGELAALRDVDYDPVNKTIDVNATLSFNVAGQRCHRGRPKNIYSIRTVSLDNRANEIISAFVLRNKADRRWFNLPGFKLPDHFIFVSHQDGYPMDLSYVNHVLRSLHYRKRLTTHVFRHTHIYYPPF